MSKGISEKIINDNLLGWKKNFITIPVYNPEQNLLFYKYRQNPLKPNENGAKYWYDKKSKSSLYGCHFHLTKNSPYVVFCEGELDALVLLSQNIPSITSTGGAGSFSKEWLPFLQKFNLIYICFDNDKAGFKGSLKLHEKLPNSIIVQLPKEIGDKGDISDYFSKLHHSTEDFLNLLKSYKISNIIFMNTKHKPKSTKTVSIYHTIKHNENIEKIQEAKEIPITIIAEELGIKTNRLGNPPMAICPFHEDKKPSMAFYPQNSYYCFGCLATGDSIELVRQIKKCSFSDAITYILSI